MAVLTGSALAKDRQLEKSEIELLTVLAQVRDARKKIHDKATAEAAKAATGTGLNSNVLRKGGGPAVLDVSGTAFYRWSDGSYNPTPQPVFRRGIVLTPNSPLSNRAGIEMCKAALRRPAGLVLARPPR